MNTVPIEIRDDIKVKFPFERFITYMIDLVPINDALGLEKIIVLNDASIKSVKFNNKTQAFYHRNKNNRGTIEIILNNIINVSIPSYAFEKYTEIGGLLLSEIVFHEIGHHVHFSRRHGVKKKGYEGFAEKYSEVGYIKYLMSRSSIIISAYRWASLNILLFNREERKMLSNARQEIINCLSRNQNKLVFP